MRKPFPFPVIAFGESQESLFSLGLRAHLLAACPDCPNAYFFVCAHRAHEIIKTLWTFPGNSARHRQPIVRAEKAST
jgi:hypothetical protein